MRSAHSAARTAVLCGEKSIGEKSVRASQRALLPAARWGQRLVGIGGIIYRRNYGYALNMKRTKAEITYMYDPSASVTRN